MFRASWTNEQPGLVLNKMQDSRARKALVMLTVLLAMCVVGGIMTKEGRNGAPKRRQQAEGVIQQGNKNYQWSNWAGTQIAFPTHFKQPSSEAELIATLQRAGRENAKVKVVGGSHSWTSIAVVDSSGPNSPTYLINLDKMNKVISVSRRKLTVTVGAGIRLYQLTGELRKRGLALKNLGAVMPQSMAGAAATATHGTGRKYGAVSSFVARIRLVKADGSVVVIDRKRNPVLFGAASVHIGALGVVTQLTLEVVPQYKLKLKIELWHAETMFQRSFEFHQKYDRFWDYYNLAEPRSSPNVSLVIAHEKVDWNTPVDGNCWKAFRPFVGLPPIRPPFPGSSGAGAEEGTPTQTESVASPDTSSRPPGLLQTVQDWCVDEWYYQLSYDILAHEDKYLEMEYFVEETQAAPMAREWHSAVDLTGSINIRSIAADDSWLSPMYKRPTACVSLVLLGNATYSGNEAEFERNARRVEQIAKRYGARPHWGKMSYVGREYLAKVFPKLKHFERVRRGFDPKGMFVNEFLKKRLEC